MVRAVVEPVDARAAGGQLSADVAMRLGDERFVEDPARDARLVGDDHDGKAARFSSRTASTLYGKEHQPIEPIEIAGLFDQRAVTIEKDRRPRRH